jgi:hypothetical protein
MTETKFGTCHSCETKQFDERVMIKQTAPASTKLRGYCWKEVLLCKLEIRTRAGQSASEMEVLTKNWVDDRTTKQFQGS